MDYLQEAILKERIGEQESEIASLKAQLAKYQASGTALNARVAEIAVLKEQLAECKRFIKEVSEQTPENLREALKETK
jgi:hypothetical protein